MMEWNESAGTASPRVARPVAPRPLPRLPVIAGAIAIYALLAVTLVFITPGLFGFHTYVGIGSSMGDTIPSGSLIVTRSLPAEEVEVGDVISFRWPNFDNPITHRVIEISDRRGEIAFVTQGDGNPRRDPFLASGDQEIGRLILSVPRLGTALPVIRAFIYVMSFALGVVLWRRARQRRAVEAGSAGYP